MIQGSATLSMAMAGARFVAALIDGLQGRTSTQCAYVASDAVKGCEFFSTPVQIGVR